MMARVEIRNRADVRACVRARSDGPVSALHVFMLRAHSVFLKAMRNWLFFLLKCNAFQAGFHGWLDGGGERGKGGRGRERDCPVRISEPRFRRQIFT